MNTQLTPAWNTQLAPPWPGPGVAAVTEQGDASTTIAVLSWAWAAVASVAGGRTTGRDEPWPAARWLAAHPSDASLVSRLAGQLS